MNGHRENLYPVAVSSPGQNADLITSVWLAPNVPIVTTGKARLRFREPVQYERGVQHMTVHPPLEGGESRVILSFYDLLPSSSLLFF